MKTKTKKAKPLAAEPHGPFTRSAEAQSVIARLDEAENRTLHEGRQASSYQYEALAGERDRALERAAVAEGGLAELRAVVRELRMDVLYARIGARGRRDAVPGAIGEPTPVPAGTPRGIAFRAAPKKKKRARR